MLAESFHPIVGGGETHARLLGEALVERGMSVRVVTQRRPRGVAPLEHVGRLPVARVAPSGGDRWGKYLMIVPALLQLLAWRGEYDVIYVCGIRTLGLPALAAGWLLGVPVVLRAESRTEVSGGYATEKAGRLLRPVVRAALGIRNRLYRRADAFVSISDDLTREFTTYGLPADRIATILNGVDTETFGPPTPGESARLREHLGLPVGPPIVVYAGKLNRGKGLEMLLRAWRRLVADDRAFAGHLLLVGGGANQFLSCEAELRAFVDEHGLGTRVTFTGYVEDVAARLRAADVFTLPSDSEALPMSLLEALSCGLPAVVTGVGGIPEVVGDGEEGLIIPPGDEDRLVAALDRLLSDPESRRRMGEAGRRTVTGRFAIDIVARRHERLFRRLVTASA